MSRELGLNLEELLPTVLLSDLLAIVLAELLNWYHSAHAKPERCFALAPKMASNPNKKQLCTTNKVAFPYSFTIV